MGRIYSGKPARDTEKAAESIINSTLASSTLIKLNESVVRLSVTDQMQSTQQIDDLYEKKSR